MAEATTVVALSPGQVRSRRDRIGEYLDAWGDVQISDDGAAGSRRLLEFALEAPGGDLPVEVRARYREYYRGQPGGEWLIARCEYEYLDVARAKRLAYHIHDLGARKLVPHAHCERATALADVEGSHHLRAVELDLRDAHERFMTFYASGREPDCRTFLPLFVPRTIG